MSSKIFDTVIVGAGVSGLSCAIELKVQNIENILLIEKSDNFFSTIRSFYKDGKRVDKYWRNQIINLIGNIPFDGGLKEEVLNYFETLLKKYNIPTIYNNEVEKVIKLDNEIFEKNGGRRQTLQVENSDLIKARLIDDMHLKF